jgi:hypothetical protein
MVQSAHDTTVMIHGSKHGSFGLQLGLGSRRSATSAGRVDARPDQHLLGRTIRFVRLAFSNATSVGINAAGDARAPTTRDSDKQKWMPRLRAANAATTASTV